MELLKRVKIFRTSRALNLLSYLLRHRLTLASAKNRIQLCDMWMENIKKNNSTGKILRNNSMQIKLLGISIGSMC